MITSLQNKQPNGNQEPSRNPKKVDERYFEALSDEGSHGVNHFQYSGERVDARQSDILIQRHFIGIVITLFAFVAFVIGVAINAITVFAHHLK